MYPNSRRTERVTAMSCLVIPSDCRISSALAADTTWSLALRLGTVTRDKLSFGLGGLARVVTDES